MSDNEERHATALAAGLSAFAPSRGGPIKRFLLFGNRRPTLTPVSTIASQ
jgi:hypothetical protein